MLIYFCEREKRSGSISKTDIFQLSVAVECVKWVLSIAMLQKISFASKKPPITSSIHPGGIVEVHLKMNRWINISLSSVTTRGKKTTLHVDQWKFVRITLCKSNSTKTFSLAHSIHAYFSCSPVHLPHGTGQWSYIHIIWRNRQKKNHSERRKAVIDLKLQVCSLAPTANAKHDLSLPVS